MDGDDRQHGANGQLDARGRARRRFTRAGLGATGVLMTLASQPGMAADVCTREPG